MIEFLGHRLDRPPIDCGQGNRCVQATVELGQAVRAFEDADEYTNPRQFTAADIMIAAALTMPGGGEMLCAIADARIPKLARCGGCTYGQAILVLEQTERPR